MRRLRTGILCISLCGLSVYPTAAQQTAPARTAPPPTVEPAPAAPAGNAASHEIAAAAVQRALADIGHTDGLYLTPRYHIPLPKALDGPIKLLAANYAGALGDVLERTINHAAEMAAPQAADFILQSLPGISLPPPGTGADVVTMALRRQLAKPLREALRPVMAAKLNDAGADAAFQKLRTRYETLANGPLAPFNLQEYAVDSFVDTFFRCIADEEFNLRSRPSLRTTDALKRAFAQ
jgi:hypothetical protein